MRRPFTRSRDGAALPRVAHGDPAAGAHSLAGMIPAAIVEAEALGATEVAGHLRMALEVARRRAAGDRTDRSPDGRGESC